MTDMSCGSLSAPLTRHMEDACALPQKAIQHNTIKLPFQNISNINTPCPDLFRAPFPLPENASWMTTDSARFAFSGDDFRATPPPLQEKLPNPETIIKAEYSYQPDGLAAEENPRKTFNALKMTRYHDYIKNILPQHEKQLSQSTSYNISHYSADCRKLIQLDSDVTQEIREKASKAYQKQKTLVNNAVSELNNMQLTTLIDEIAAICDPSKDLSHCYYKANAMLDKACKHANPYQLWDYLKENEPLKAWLEDSNFGQKILAELDAIPSESEDYDRFTLPQLQLINRILAFCKPINGQHLHALYRLDLSGKSAHGIIHTLIQNQGIKEILNASFYGENLWQRLMNCPLILELLDHNKKMESKREKITQKQKILNELQSRSLASRFFNIWKIKRKEKTIEKIKTQLREDIHVHHDIIMGRDNYFKYIQNLSQGDIYKTLRELSRENVTLQKNIDKVINLSESAEKVTPEFLFLESKMIPFIHIARALTLCDVFTKNIGNTIETLTNAIIQLYPSSPDIRKFISSLENPLDEIPLILANGYLLPPHISGQERQTRMRLLSQVISMREQELPPVTDPQRLACLEKPEEWCADWSEPLDDHTLKATVNVWFDAKRAPAPEDILVQISKKLAISLDPDTLARNIMVSVELDKNLVEKLKIKPALQKIIKQHMSAFMLAKDEYADPTLKKARFNIKIAELLDKRSEKLAWDLEKIRLTGAHFRAQQFTDEDILLTDSHLQTIDHLILFNTAIRNCMEVRNALAELHDIYREEYNDETDLDFIYECMEDIFLGDDGRLTSFQQTVNDVLSESNIAYFCYFDPEYYGKLNAIKKKLLSFTCEGLNPLFNTMNDTGIMLEEECKQQISTNIFNYLFDKSRREGKSASRVLSLLLHSLFTNNIITDLPEPQTIGHPHQYLDNLSSGLIRQMDNIIDHEIDRILAEFPPSKPKNIAYVNACCQLIQQPAQYQNIFNALTSHQPDVKKISPAEYNTLKNALKAMLKNNPAMYQEIGSKIISKLQQQRMDEDLYWLASMVYWHDFFSMRRARYLAVNSDQQRKKEIDSLYDLTQYLFLDELNTEYNAWRASTGATSGKLTEFILSIDQKNKISESIAFHFSLLNKELTGALQKLSEEKRREHKRAVDEMNLRIGLTFHYHEMEWQRQKSNREKLWRDMYNRHEKDIEIKNKSVIRDWKNQYHQRIAENIALQREMEWAFLRDRKNKIERAITPTTRAMAHAWRNREVYVVIGAKIGHKSRVIIHNSSGPVNHHDTYDNDISPTCYYVVKVKAKDFNDDMRDMFSSLKPARGAPQASKSWRPKPGEAPTIDGRRLMKIIIEKTDEINHEVLGVFNKYGDIPVKVNQPTPDLDAMMEKVKAEYLKNPGKDKNSAATDNLAAAAPTSQSTALPSASNALVLPERSHRFWPEWPFPEPELPQASQLPPLPPLPESAKGEKESKIDLFPASTHMAEQLISPLGWMGENAEMMPYMISRTEMYANKILVITDGNGKVIEAIDSASGDAFPKSQLSTTQKAIAAIRLEGEHYDPWLPDRSNEKHAFISMQERRRATGSTPAMGTVHYLDTGKSTIHKIRGDGFCLTEAAAIAVDLNYGIFTGAQLRAQLVKVLSSGQYEEMLQQPTFYDQSR